MSIDYNSQPPKWNEPLGQIFFSQESSKTINILSPQVCSYTLQQISLKKLSRTQMAFLHKIGRLVSFNDPQYTIIFTCSLDLEIISTSRPRAMLKLLWLEVEYPYNCRHSISITNKRLLLLQ